MKTPIPVPPPPVTMYIEPPLSEIISYWVKHNPPVGTDVLDFATVAVDPSQDRAVIKLYLQPVPQRKSRENP